MDILYVLVFFSLAFSLAFLAAFFWVVDTDQLNRLDSVSWSVLDEHQQQKKREDS